MSEGPYVERRLRRWLVDFQALLWIEGAALDCSVQDISPGGARVRLSGARDATVGSMVELELDDYPPIVADVRHRDDYTMGLMFLHGPDEEASFGRYLIASRPARPEPRETVGLPATLMPQRAGADCVIVNISRSGAGVTVAEAHGLAVGDEVRIAIDDHGELGATVRRVVGNEIGVKFDKAIIGDLPE